MRRGEAGEGEESNVNERVNYSTDLHCSTNNN